MRPSLAAISPSSGSTSGCRHTSSRRSLEGIHYRYIQGQTVGPGFDGIGDTVHALLKAGLAAIEEVD